MTLVESLQSLPDPRDASEAAWLPAGPTGGILERLRGFSAADDEWWHEERRNACRAYLGTKLNWHPASPRQSVMVEPGDLHSDLHRAMLADLRLNFPWTDVIDLMAALSSGDAAHRFGAAAVRLEWADCMALGSEYKDVDVVAEAVHFCRRRDERAKIIKRLAGVAHSPEEVAELCARLAEVK